MLTTFFLLGKEKILYPKKKTKCFVSKKETMGVSQKKPLRFVSPKKQSGLYSQKKQNDLHFPKKQTGLQSQKQPFFEKSVVSPKNDCRFIFQQCLLSKKGSGWLLFFFVVFLTLMGGVLMYEVYQLRQPGSVQFGEKQIALFQLYGDSEEKVLGLREYVRRVRDESVEELASNGGFSKDNACGKWVGEVVWGYDKCWPDVEKNFQLLMERKLGEKGLRFEWIAYDNGKVRVGFGDFEFSREFWDGKIMYTRNITIEEDAGLDFVEIQVLKRKLIEARNKGDYSGLGKVENGYLRLSIENDKNALKLLQGEGFVAEKPVFRFWVRIS